MQYEREFYGEAAFVIALIFILRRIVVAVAHFATGRMVKVKYSDIDSFAILAAITRGDSFERIQRRERPTD